MLRCACTTSRRIRSHPTCRIIPSPFRSFTRTSTVYQSPSQSPTQTRIDDEMLSRANAELAATFGIDPQTYIQSQSASTSTSTSTSTLSQQPWNQFTSISTPITITPTSAPTSIHVDDVNQIDREYFGDILTSRHPTPQQQHTYAVAAAAPAPAAAATRSTSTSTSTSNSTPTSSDKSSTQRKQPLSLYQIRHDMASLMEILILHGATFSTRSHFVGCLRHSNGTFTALNLDCSKLYSHEALPNVDIRSRPPNTMQLGFSSVKVLKESSMDDINPHIWSKCKALMQSSCSTIATNEDSPTPALVEEADFPVPSREHATSTSNTSPIVEVCYALHVSMPATTTMCEYAIKLHYGTPMTAALYNQLFYCRPPRITSDIPSRRSHQLTDDITITADATPTKSASSDDITSIWGGSLYDMSIRCDITKTTVMVPNYGAIMFSHSIPLLFGDIMYLEKCATSQRSKMSDAGADLRLDRISKWSELGRSWRTLTLHECEQERSRYLQQHTQERATSRFAFERAQLIRSHLNPSNRDNDEDKDLDETLHRYPSSMDMDHAH